MPTKQRIATTLALLLIASGCPGADDAGATDAQTSDGPSTPDGQSQADAGARLFTATCTGHVTAYQDNGEDLFGGQVGVDDPVTLTYSYDLDTAGIGGQYTMPAPPSGFSVTFESWTLNPTTASPVFFSTEVRDSATSPDSLYMLCIGETATPSLAALFAVELTLSNENPATLTSDALPASPFLFGATDTAEFVIRKDQTPWTLGGRLDECH